MSSTVADLVEAARQGDPDAWDQLVSEYHPLLWRVARSHGLDHATAADVVQFTWLKLVENLGRLTDPDRVRAWLVTTARRESIAVLRKGARAVPTQDPARHTVASDGDQPEARALVEGRNDVLVRAFQQLGERCRSLLALLCADPPVPYDEISQVMDVPIGSIGPTRGRCLDQLRALVPASITWR